MTISTTTTLLPVLSSALDTALARRTAAWHRRHKADSAVRRHEGQVERWSRRGRADLRGRAELRLMEARAGHQEANEAFLQLCTEHTSIARAWELLAATLVWQEPTGDLIAAHLTAEAYDTGYVRDPLPGLPGYETGTFRPDTWGRAHALAAVLRHSETGSRIWLDQAGAVRIAWSKPGAPVEPGRAFLSLVPQW